MSKEFTADDIVDWFVDNYDEASDLPRDDEFFNPQFREVFSACDVVQEVFAEQYEATPDAVDQAVRRIDLLGSHWVRSGDTITFMTDSDAYEEDDFVDWF